METLQAPAQTGHKRLDREKQKFQKWLNSSDYQERLTQRLKINDSCLRNKESQILTKQLCAEDPIFFIENFGWTFDPRMEHAPNNLPFIMYPYQKEIVMKIVSHIRNGEDLVIEKSRDMGATWLFIYVFYWFWLFGDAFSGLLGSYKEVLVDNRTKDSLMGMIDYAMDSTPKWMMPRRFKPKDHRQKLKLVNPENYNIIAGDTMNPDFGRGSRRTVVFLDEGASWEYFREAWESCGDVTPCRLTVSTPKGRNAFALLRESGIDVLTIHWRQHPMKDEDWYEFEKSRRSDEEVAQELDISYHRSQEGRVYPEWDLIEWGSYSYDEQLPLYVSWDFGLSDDTAMIWFQSDYTGRIRIIDAYSNRGKTIEFYIPFVTGVISSDRDFRYTPRDLKMIENHKAWKQGTHFGDPAGRFLNQVTNTSVMDVLRQNGIIVNFREEAKDFQTRKSATKILLKRTLANKNDGVKELGLSIENAKYPMVRRGGQDQVRSQKPAHDWTSHYRSALEYFAVNYERYGNRSRGVRDKFPRKERRGLINY